MVSGKHMSRKVQELQTRVEYQFRKGGECITKAPLFPQQNKEKLIAPSQNRVQRRYSPHLGDDLLELPELQLGLSLDFDADNLCWVLGASTW